MCKSTVNGQTTQIGAVSSQSGSKRRSMFRSQCRTDPNYSAAYLLQTGTDRRNIMCVGLHKRVLERQSVKCYLRSWSESGARNGFSEDLIGFSAATGEEGSEGLVYQPR